jgi:hypothetical protein
LLFNLERTIIQSNDGQTVLKMAYTEQSGGKTLDNGPIAIGNLYWQLDVQHQLLQALHVINYIKKVSTPAIFWQWVCVDTHSIGMYLIKRQKN